MAHPSRARRGFTALQKPEAMELCLQEGLSCNAVAERLGLPLTQLEKENARIRKLLAESELEKAML